MQLRNIPASARVELLEPRAQKPSYRLLLQLAASRVQNALNEANNTHRAWAIDDVTLSVGSGEDEYLIPRTGIGKILDVTTVYDTETMVESQIPFYDIGEMSGDWSGWNYDNAKRMAFYRKKATDSLYVRIRPMPSESQDYRITFTVGSWAEGAALDDTPFLEAHHHYIVCDVARDALPAAEWFDDEERNAIRRRNLDQSLSRRVEAYYKQFRLNIASLTVPRNSMRLEAFPIE